ncbi:glucose 1-dehydrogenase [Alicyclobacillus fastidiosus]|uniref:Glucose 1-dehydrogenase n=1 Tax=Alicyclobacillus fastidiosus TaxID=392011 RepID=A0ABY6ZJJ8_9BACL|nr:glucose 1-dehydrogenase [Alicyclobacillus fastidiosus]WAH43082.1 glucose 1-dehydrogenase [Alicyclobacillus fastidiosus]GMA65073.1 dehydrogenase [Alicyclobacillus fastidiosus]
MGRLDGKVALITGAAQGMGASHARKFIKEGAKVILTDINEKGGSALAEELGSNALFLKHDVTSKESWEQVVEKGISTFGEITVLVNNAGVLGPIAKTDELSEEDYLKVCGINQHGVFFGMKTVIPSMLKAGIGSIVNISSIAGVVAIYGFPSLAYVASKFAVRGMTKATAVEYGSRNIRANSVHPGFIKTPMMAAATDESGGEATSMIPLGRLAEPEEVSNLVLFLASDESSYITASEHLIDAGMSAH